MNQKPSACFYHPRHLSCNSCHPQETMVRNIEESDLVVISNPWSLSLSSTSSSLHPCLILRRRDKGSLNRTSSAMSLLQRNMYTISLIYLMLSSHVITGTNAKNFKCDYQKFPEGGCSDPLSTACNAETDQCVCRVSYPVNVNGMKMNLYSYFEPFLF